MKAEEVLQYLQSHPQFFEDHAEIISTITIPHPYSGRAISLTERQLLTLRENNRKLEDRLAEMLRYGEENDQTSEKLHHLAVALVAASNLAKVRSVLYARLHEDFNIAYPVLRLWGTAFAHNDGEALLVSDAQKAIISRLQAPFCGEIENADPSLFGATAAPQIRSQALIPLRSSKGSEPFGVLAFGSEDKTRFNNDMGTLYLIRTGELASAAILRACV